MLGDRNDSAGRIPHRAADHIKDLGYAKEKLQQSLNGEWGLTRRFLYMSTIGRKHVALRVKGIKCE